MRQQCLIILTALVLFGRVQRRVARGMAKSKTERGHTQTAGIRYQLAICTTYPQLCIPRAHLRVQRMQIAQQIYSPIPNNILHSKF